MRHNRLFLGTGAVLVGTGLGPSPSEAQPPRLSTVFESVEPSPGLPEDPLMLRSPPPSSGNAIIGRLVACAGMGAMLGSAVGTGRKDQVNRRGLGGLMTPAAGAALGVLGCLVLNPPRR